MIATGSRLAPGFVLLDQQLLQALSNIPSLRVETYAENLDLVRFSSHRYSQIFSEYLIAKYAAYPPDLIILGYVGNLGTPGKLLPEIFPGTPIIVAGFTEERLQNDQFSPFVRGLAQRVNPGATFELIQRIQPEVRRVIVIGGTAEVDRQVLDRVREAARPFKERMNVEIWDNLSMTQLSQQVTKLPPQTAILYARLFRDGAGQGFISSEVGRWIGEWANVPVYVMSDVSLGSGAVGGAISSIEEFGQRAGELARQVLTGTDIRSLNFEIRTDSVPTFDWRALQRWRIPESRLPSNSVIRFRPASIWQAYREYTVSAAFIFAVQAAMIGGLLVLRRRRHQTENRLKETQELMELATSAGGLGLWSRDLKDGRIWVNSTMRSLFGFAPDDELRFEDLTARVHSQDRPRMLEEVDRAQAAGLPFSGEFRIVLPNGTERWMMARGRTIRNFSRGETQNRVGAVWDITERKRAEEKFRSAVESSPNAILMIDARGGILLANIQAEKLFNYTRDELLDGSFEKLVRRGLIPGERTVMQQLLRDMQSAEGSVFLGYMFALRKDGREVPIEIGLSPIRNDEAAVILASIIDVSERQKAAEALEKERKYLRQVIDIDPTLIFAKDREGHFTLANKAVAQMYGTTVENLIGKTDADFNPNHEEVEFFHRVDREVIDSLRERFIPEERLTDAHGKIHWVQTVKRPIFAENGSDIQVLGASTDITHRKATDLELQEQRAQLAHVARISNMGELAASLAHELNQPLTAILSNAQAALRFMNSNPPELEEVREILEDIVKDNSRAGDVIRRMRALVKKEVLEFAAVDLAALVGDVLSLVHSDAILQNVTITLDVTDNLVPVRGDRIQLQQVVLNLLLNAFDAMKSRPKGEREVKIQLEDTGIDWVQLSVSDRGTGLSSEQLDRIFQPFFTTKREGLGMGLSICRTIIEAHGGHLWAENNLKHGATFYFIVPAASAVAKDETRSAVNQ
jgi:PAS domain S-box-containing protein